MTQKDLLYLEDAYTHQENLIKIWKFYTEIILDEELVEFINGQIDKLTKSKDKIMKLLEETKNE